jgi:membrane protease YdiL (CAAX protease family)
VSGWLGVRPATAARVPAGAAALAGALLVLALWQGGLWQPGPAAAQALVLLVLAPLLEETVWRAGLHEALLRRGVRPGVAVVAVALAFAGAHLLWWGSALALAVAVPALLIGVAYQHTRRVRLCVLLHAAMNAAWWLAPAPWRQWADWGGL